MLDKQLIGHIVEWDVATWKQALPFWERCAGDLTGAKVLDIGSRHGGLSLYFALRGCRVVCSDLQGPTKDAMALHKRYNVSDQVCYRRIDATGIDAPDGEFDVVTFKSVLGAIGRDEHLERIEQAVGEMQRVLRPGGKVLFAENLRASFLHAYLRRAFVQWGSTWRYIASDELPRLFAGFATLQIQCYGFWAALGRSERQHTLLHGLDVVTGPMVPRSWRYVAFGCATK